MGLFDTEEDKAKKAARRDSNIRFIMGAHDLGFDGRTDDELAEDNNDGIYSINADLADNGIYGIGSVSLSNKDNAYLVSLLRALVDQNWVLMRQNEQIIRLLREHDG